MKKVFPSGAALLFFILVACGDQKSVEKPTEATPPTSESQQQAQAEESVNQDSVATEIQMETDTLLLLSDSLQADSVFTSSIAGVTDENDYFALVPNEIIANGLINQSDIPTIKEIGIRPHPDSYVLKLGKPFDYNGKTYNTLEMASIVPPDEILSFYEQWKDKWFYVQNSGVHTFKKEQDAYFRETNNLQIQPYQKNRFDGIDSLLTFKPQTYIFIYYEVKGESNQEIGKEISVLEAN